jgi:hypothetical protein
MASAVTFAVVGLLWVNITSTGQWGGASCTGPPPLRGHRASLGCTYFLPHWEWLAFWTALGALFGRVLAVAALRLNRLNRGRTEDRL